TPDTKITKYLFRRFFRLPSGTPATVRVNGQGFPIQTHFDAIAIIFSLAFLPPAGLSQTQTLHDFGIPLALLMSRLTYTLGWTNQPVVVCVSMGESLSADQTEYKVHWAFSRSQPNLPTKEARSDDESVESSPS